jgi:hypothetical protein
MPKILSDTEIQALLTELKLLPPDYEARINPKPKRGHNEREIELTGNDGNDFRLIIRQSILNVFDFSVILAYLPKQTTQVFRVRRYNGKSHEHSNILERQSPFYGFHIHTATERYQNAMMREDWFAEITHRYGDLRSALDCMITDCGLILPSGQTSLQFGKEAES